MPKKTEPETTIDRNLPPGARALAASRRWQRDTRQRRRKRSRAQPTRIVALEEDADGVWTAVIKGQDIANNTKTLRIRLGTQGYRTREQLKNAGFDYDAVERIEKQLINPSVKLSLPKIKVVERAGWHKLDRNELTYLWPGVPSAKAPHGFDSVVFRHPEDEPLQPRPTGTIDGWKKQVARPCPSSYKLGQSAA